MLTSIFLLTSPTGKFAKSIKRKKKPTCVTKEFLHESDRFFVCVFLSSILFNHGNP